MLTPADLATVLTDAGYRSVHAGHIVADGTHPTLTGITATLMYQRDKSGGGESIAYVLWQGRRLGAAVLPDPKAALEAATADAVATLDELRAGLLADLLGVK